MLKAPRIRRRAGLLVMLLLAAANSVAAAGNDKPKNMVVIDDRLTTSGQPPAGYFGDLASQGFGLVINLAPPDSSGSIENEGALVANNGMIYVNIPVDWHAPTGRDFAYFRAALDASDDRRTLVHCQVNMRGSSFTFLHRVISQGVAPEDALEAVHAVWVPDATWTKFIEDTLAAHGIEFEL